MALGRRYGAIAAMLLISSGFDVAYGDQRNVRPIVRWETPPGVLNLRLPPMKHTLPVQIEVKAPVEDLPPLFLPRPDHSHAPWGSKPYIEVGHDWVLRPPGPVTVRVVPPASGFIGPNCGQRCAEKRAQGAARTEYRLW